MADVITGLQDDDIATEWRHEKASASDDDGTDGDADGTDGDGTDGDADGTDGGDADGTDA
ncbi:MAG TPA: hypothetical protein VKB57_11090 [Acidimicrobiales bacterium]|nr:hypothetical protein [Acidimicrobiales bacterium]